LLACSSGRADQAERTALGALVNAVRRDAPSVEVHDIPVDRLQLDDSWPPIRVAVPLTLTDGTDVAAALAIARRHDPTLRVAAPIGPDWAVAEICVQRLIEAGARKDDTIVLGVAGSDDDSALEGFSRAARLVSAVWGGPVHLGSVGGRDTPLTDAVDIARAYGRRVVVASYLLTPGRFTDMLRHCGADLVTGPLLDGGVPDHRLSALVVSRFHQALDVGALSL
jgi:sirohydrochlorin ferrochelatase